MTYRFWQTILVIALLLSPALLPGQSWKWVRDYASSDFEYGNDITIQEDSLWVYAVGDFDGTLPSLPGPPSATIAGQTDGVIVKLDTAGNYLNHAIVRSSRDLSITSVATDDTGNVFITGYFSQDADFQGNGPSAIPLAAGGTDKQVFVAKFNNQLEGQWARQAGSIGNEDSGLSLDISGDSVFVTGIFRGLAPFGALPVLGSNGVEDIFIALYDGNTGTEQWAVSAGGLGIDVPGEIVADGNALYVGGDFQSGSITFQGTVNQTVFNSSANNDVFLARFDPSDGGVIWASSAGGGNTDVCGGVAVDGSGVYITGGFQATANFGAAGNIVSGGPSTDIFVCAYNKSTGASTWVRAEGANAGIDEGLDIATDGMGTVLCTGRFTGTVNFGGIRSLTSSGGTDIVAFSYTNTGTFSGALNVSNGNDAAGTGIDFGADGIYVTGFFTNGPALFPSFPNIIIPSNTQENMFVGKIECLRDLNGASTVTVATSPICIGDSTTITVTNSNPMFTYQLQDTAGNVSIGPPEPGNGGNIVFNTGALFTPTTYHVFVTDGNLCYGYLEDTVDVMVLPFPPPSLGPDTALCEPFSLTLDGGAYVSYIWSTGATTQTINVSSGGTYELTITDGTGCMGADTIVVTGNPLPIVDIGPDTSICPAGSITIGAQPGQTYLWSTGATTDSITINTAGQYYLDLTDGNGCMNSDTMNLSIEPIVQPNLGNDTAFCSGGSVLLDAGNPAASFLWSTGATTQMISVSATGQYFVDVTVGACTLSDTIDITVHPLPIVNIGPDTSICPATSVTIGAQPGQTYLWSTGATTDSITISAAGQYYLDLTDGNGCMNSDTMNLAIEPIVQPNLGNDTAFCIGGSVLLDAGNPAATFNWSTGATTQTINVSTSGQYFVDVRVGTCTLSDTIDITVHPLPAVDIGPDTTICLGDSIRIGAQTGQSYLWSTGATTDSIVIQLAGQYYVDLTDGNGCQNSDSMNLALTTVPPPVLGNDTAFCTGGSVTLDAGAGGSYLWSTGATTQTINVTTTGQYWVDKSLSGCTVSDTIDITVNPLPVVDLGPDSLICAGESLTIGAPTGLSYLWSTGATTDSITINTAGQYYVDVTDGNSCQNSDTMNLTVTTVPPPVLGNDTAFCAGGSVTLDAGTGGSILWSTGATTQTINVSTSGQYYVDKTAGNCIETDTINITVNPLPVVNLGPDSLICAGESLTIGAPTGLSYLWSTGATTDSITINTAGQYYVDVTDGNSCQSSDTMNLTVTTVPPPVLGNDTAFCAGGSVTLDAGTGGAILWSTGATTQTINVSTSGQYYVDKSAGNCIETDTINITVYGRPAVNLGPDTTLCGAGAIQLGAPSGGTYLWSTGATTDSIFASATGQYWVVATNGNGCSGTDTMNLTVVNIQPVSLGNDTAFCANDSLVLDAGNAGAAFLWSTGATTQTITVNASGQYDVAVTLGSCVERDTILITVDTLPLVDIGPDTALCTGGSLTIGTTPGQTYLWSTGATTDSITINTAGQYYVDVTDGNGCMNSDTMNLSVVNIMTPNLGPDTTFCDGDSLFLDAMNAGASFLWSTGATSQSIYASTTGQYWVHVTAGICQSSDTVNVTVDPIPQVNLGPDTSFCTAGSLQIGAPPGLSTYLWSTGATTDSIVVSSSGQYWVNASNATGCTGTDTMNLTIVPITMPNLGADTSFCAGGSLTLDAGNAGAGYLWSTGDTVQTISVSTTGQYTVEVTLANCTTFDTIDVTVLPLPTFSLGADTSICDGDSLPLTGPSGAAYLWSTGDTAQSITVSAAGTYWLVLTDSNGCGGADSLDLSLRPNPLVNLVDTLICSGGSATFDAGNAGASYVWTNGATTQQITVTDTGWYGVDVTLNGCLGDDSAFVGFHPDPQPDLGADTTICDGTLLELAAGNFTQYLWSTGSTAAGITVSSAGTYGVTVTDANGCSASDEMSLATQPRPQAEVFGLAPDYCETDSASELILMPPGGVLTGPVSGSFFDPAVAGAGPHKVVYVYTDTVGCADTVDISTIVHAPPSPAEAGPDQNLEGATATTLQAIPPQVGTGTWSFYLGSATLENANDPTSGVSMLEAGTYGLSWTVSNGFCPDNVDSMRIVIENMPELVIPTGFSPNNDGKNEAWVIRGIEAFPTRSVTVFNRWGNEVYRADLYENDWTGLNSKGGTLADDTYYFVLDLGESGTRSGYVVIKR